MSTFVPLNPARKPGRLFEVTFTDKGEPMIIDVPSHLQALVDATNNQCVYSLTYNVSIHAMTVAAPGHLWNVTAVYKPLDRPAYHGYWAISTVARRVYESRGPEASLLYSYGEHGLVPSVEELPHGAILGNFKAEAFITQWSRQSLLEAATSVPVPFLTKPAALYLAGYYRIHPNVLGIVL